MSLPKNERFMAFGIAINEVEEPFDDQTQGSPSKENCSGLILYPINAMDLEQSSSSDKNYQHPIQQLFL